MRISDWSSDVCSSDLDEIEHRRRQVMADRIAENFDVDHEIVMNQAEPGFGFDRAICHETHAIILSVCKSGGLAAAMRSEEHTSELQSLMRSSYAVFCLEKKNTTSTTQDQEHMITT